MSLDNNWQQGAWRQPEAPGQPPVPPPSYGFSQAPVKRRGWIVGLVAVILLFAVIVLGMWSCTSVMSSSFGALGGVSDASDGADALMSDAVGVINIDGTIQYDGTTASPDGLKAQLDRAEKNKHIKAVVLRVNSGGGTATAGEEMASYVREFSERSGKPVVVSSASINASAAYEISSQADYIYTANTTAIGAIGTVMQVHDLSGLLGKLGIGVDNVKSAESKDSSYGTRPLTDEERAYYQAQVDQINDTFVNTVAKGRKMDVEQVRALATGLTFTGTTAVQNGLADAIGTKEDAVSKAAELANVSNYTTVVLQPKKSDLSALLDLVSKNGVSTDDVARALKELETDGRTLH